MPLFNFVAQRTNLPDHAAKLEDRDCEFEEANRIGNALGDGKSDSDSPYPICDKGLKAFWVKENMKSIDGLPSLTFAPISGVAPIHAPPEKRVEPAPTQASLPEVGSESAESVLGSSLDREEVIRLVFTFSMGLAVAAVYVQLAGAAGCSL